MTNKTPARSRADIQFASQSRDAMVKNEIEKERASMDARTIKLRAMRMARDAERAAEKVKADALNPPKAAKKARVKKPA